MYTYKYQPIISKNACLAVTVLSDDLDSTFVSLYVSIMSITLIIISGAPLPPTPKKQEFEK